MGREFAYIGEGSLECGISARARVWRRFSRIVSAQI